MKAPPLQLAAAQARLLALAPRLPVEHRLVGECLGQFLAEPLLARRTQPAAPLSAMDGYALRSGDGPGPWKVIGESAAGRPFDGVIGAGEAVRISTGAIVPQGADTVVLQEDAQRHGDTVSVGADALRHAPRHIRPLGMDFAEHDLLIAAGTRIGPAQIALAIAAGHAHLPVHRRVKLTVIDSGDELVPPGQRTAEHQLPASNGPMLCAMAASLPVDIRHVGPVADQLGALTCALEDAADADVIVTSGGASVGDHDLVRPSLMALGASLDFWRVAIKPGKPLLVATRGQQVVLGLPGNPASAFVTAYLFMLPLLRAASGAARALPMPMAAVLATPMPKGGGRTEFLRGFWNGHQVTLDSLQDSGALSPLARANVLVLREAGAPARAVGEEVYIYLLENGGFA